jgi:competence protein ComGC
MILERTISNKHKYIDLVRKSNRNFKFVKMVVIMLITSMGLISTIPILAYAQQQQQQTNFMANLSGKDVQPTPVNTPATGTAKFQLNQNGTISYEVDAKNLDKVIDASIDYKNGTEVVSLINPYATVPSGFNQVKSVYPTGPINGKLTDGVITSDKLTASGFQGNVTSLANVMKGGSLNAVIRTQPHQEGEIAGQISPSK